MNPPFFGTMFYGMLLIRHSQNIQGIFVKNNTAFNEEEKLWTEAGFDLRNNEALSDILGNAKLGRSEVFDKRKNAVEIIGGFHQSKPTENLSWHIFGLVMRKNLPDFPAICWHPFVSACTGSNSEHHYIKYKKDDDFFVNKVFSKNRSCFRSKDILNSLEKNDSVVHISYVYLGYSEELKNSLFKIERTDDFFRITEYDANKITFGNSAFSIIQTFYASSRVQVESLLDLLLNSSLDFLSFKSGQVNSRPSTSFFSNEDVSFLEKGHCSRGKAISAHESGIGALLLAVNAVSVDFLCHLMSTPNMRDFIKSEENKQNICQKEMARKVRLDVNGSPDERKDGSTPSSRTISCNINPVKMSRYPVIQGFDPRLPHPVFKEPYKVIRMTHGNNYDSISKDEIPRLIRIVNRIVQNPDIRENYENKYYRYEQIKPNNIKNNGYEYTLGINGVTAKIDIPKFTPLIYKHQYAEKGSKEHVAIITAIANYLGDDLNLYNKKINNSSDLLSVNQELFIEAAKIKPKLFMDSSTLYNDKKWMPERSRVIYKWLGGWWY